jgi:hypothetical protein
MYYACALVLHHALMIFWKLVMYMCEPYFSAITVALPCVYVLLSHACKHTEQLKLMQLHQAYIYTYINISSQRCE